MDLLRRCGVVVILRVALPVIDVDVRQTRDKQLKFLLVENGDQFRRDNVMEA